MLRLAPPRPRVPVRPRRVMMRPRAAIDLQEGAALVGKGLGLFVLFTSSMNWWFYRRVREEAENKNKDKK